MLAERLAVFYPEGHQAHFQQGHPERPERVETIRQSLEAIGVWEKAVHVDPRFPLPEVLEKVHDPAYLSLLERAAKRGGGLLDSDTYVAPRSWDLALQSAGGAIEVSRLIWRGESIEGNPVRRGFALSRPPGHHATHGQGMGFCLLNNIAIAAQHLIQFEGAGRLAIIDLDLHHGNGTQDIFWKRSDVLFISTHQAPLYPGSGTVYETGEGEGAGWTANMPMPPGSGDNAYEAAVQELILPILLRARPEMLLVSYGFDPHWRDPLGNLRVSAAGYGRIITALTEFADMHCGGKIALVLEGGYDLDAASACSQAVTTALLGLDWKDPLGPSPDSEYEFTHTAWRRNLDAAVRLAGL